MFTTTTTEESRSADAASEAAPEKPEAAGTTPALPETENAETANGEDVAAVAPEAAQDPKSKPKLKAIRFYRVTVRDGGTLETRGDIVIKLDGIDAYPADQTCKDKKGKKWACGMRGRTALTRLIRGRAVVCRVPENAKSVTARCTLAGTDLSTWIVSHGWAKPAAPAEPKLAKAAEAAQKKRIGVWR